MSQIELTFLKLCVKLTKHYMALSYMYKVDTSTHFVRPTLVPLHAAWWLLPNPRGTLPISDLSPRRQATSTYWRTPEQTTSSLWKYRWTPVDVLPWSFHFRCFFANFQWNKNLSGFLDFFLFAVEFLQKKRRHFHQFCSGNRKALRSLPRCLSRTCFLCIKISHHGLSKRFWMYYNPGENKNKQNSLAYHCGSLPYYFIIGEE